MHNSKFQLIQTSLKMLLGLTPFQCTLKLLNPNETMLSVNKALLQQSVAYNLSIMALLKKCGGKELQSNLNRSKIQEKRKGTTAVVCYQKVHCTDGSQ